MCSAESSASVGLASSRFSSTVNQIGCSIPWTSPLPGLLPGSTRRRATAEAGQLENQLDQHRGDHCKQSCNQINDRQSKSRQNNIRDNQQQSVAADEFE